MVDGSFHGSFHGSLYGSFFKLSLQWDINRGRISHYFQFVQHQFWVHFHVITLVFINHRKFVFINLVNFQLTLNIELRVNRKLTMMQTIMLVQTMIWTTGDGGVCDSNYLLQYHILMKVWYLQNHVYFIITNVFKEI